MFSLKRLLLLSFIFLPINALAISGYIKTDLFISDKDLNLVATSIINSGNASVVNGTVVYDPTPSN